jgi:hypothetical protein
MMLSPAATDVAAVTDIPAADIRPATAATAAAGSGSGGGEGYGVLGVVGVCEDLGIYDNTLIVYDYD